MTSVILSCGLNGFEGRHRANRASRAEPPEFRLPRILPPGGQICAHTGKPCFPYADSAIPCLAGTQATHRLYRRHARTTRWGKQERTRWENQTGENNTIQEVPQTREKTPGKRYLAPEQFSRPGGTSDKRKYYAKRYLRQEKNTRQEVPPT